MAKKTKAYLGILIENIMLNSHDKLCRDIMVQTCRATGRSEGGRHPPKVYRETAAAQEIQNLDVHGFCFSRPTVVYIIVASWKWLAMKPDCGE